MTETTEDMKALVCRTVNSIGRAYANGRSSRELEIRLDKQLDRLILAATHEVWPHPGHG